LLHGQFVADFVGTVGQRQVDAARADRRARRALVRRVLIDNVDITRLDEDALAAAARREDRFVFQFFHLIPSLTAYENVAVPMEIAGVADARRARAAAAKKSGLTGRAHHYPSQLSGGEQQRVRAGARARQQPPIVLADEPTGNLDSANGRHIMELLRTIHAAAARRSSS
jgi:putative ABC transport system ATP-binding protein